MTGPTGPTGSTGATGATGTNGATGYLRITGTRNPTTGTNTTQPKTSTATCTGGTKVIGGGYEIFAATETDLGEVNIYVNHATSDTVWTITAREDNATGGWAIQAYAICANVGI